MAGAIVNVRDDRGRKPLFEAVRHDALETAHLLCRLSADCAITDCNGATVLHQSRYELRGRAVLLPVLIDAGAPVNATNRDGDSPLHIAARDWHCEYVMVLLECGARINVRNNKGDTPLHVMADDDEIASALLDAGADVNAQNNEGNNTPLHEMAQRGDGLMVALLLRRGADPNIMNGVGQKALDLYSGHEQTLRKSLEALLGSADSA